MSTKYTLPSDLKKQGYTELMYCVLKNDLKAVKEIISKDTINANNDIGETVLHIACIISSSNIKIVELLLKNGADPNAKTNFNERPLHYASKTSTNTISIAIVEALLRSGADPNAKSMDDWAPLHTASSYSDDTRTVPIAIVKLLLRSGADPNVKGQFDWTPLHCALGYVNRASTRSIETVKLLLRSGATPIDKETQILKLEIDIESLVEANEKLRQKILLLEDED